MARIRERKPNVQRLWIHAVSVGEATAAEPLIKALKAKFPKAEVVISITTLTGHAVAERKYGPENVVFYPHDFSWVVRRFLNAIKPSIVILMELEVWPNMTAEAKARGIPIVVANARITRRSAKRYKLGWSLVGRAFNRPEKWLAQTVEYAERLHQLGVDPQRIEIAGNIKYDAVDTSPPSPEQRAALRAELGIAPEAPVLIGGSTHPTEESALLDAYKNLRATACPALRLILVPRHPERLNSVEDEIKSAGLIAVRKSALDARPLLPTPYSPLPAPHSLLPPPHSPPVLLIDTMGELKRMYAAADVAFIGGSLIPHGGQNIMEPCGMGVAAIHGPHMHNFNDAMEILRACNGSLEITRETLAPTLERLLKNRDEAQAMAARAREGFLKKLGATSRVVETIGALLQSVRAKK
ncbi:MAG TPA: 3-deoxy-D-manno-octulosonic acid transferase [Planctomycetota bacterium]|nr:3-deoxy-D-manno-octulosonic acid transferase [Planctomycetota bacterium]